MIDLKLDIDSVQLVREISDIQRKQIPFALMLAQTRLATHRIKPGITQVMAKRTPPVASNPQEAAARSRTRARPSS